MDDSQCCIAGAGPAGMVLALLLARKGVSVTLLEVHSDLARDFRGDTVHASTLELLDQIGLADRVLSLPHTKLRKLSITTGTGSINAISFERVKTRFPYVAMMPQEALLECLLDEASRFPNFHMKFNTGVSGIVEEDGRVVGVTARVNNELHEIRSELVVASDGRFSRLRKMTGFTAETQSPGMDVAWFRLPREASDPEGSGGFYVAEGRLCILLARPNEWQIAYLVLKGDFQQIRDNGIAAFRSVIGKIVPLLASRVDQLEDFSQLHLLDVKADRLERWYKDGLLFIGDAAHVMSPVGGVGINYAICDAIEATNVLAPKFEAGDRIVEAHLKEIQDRRERPTARVQKMQSVMQNTIIRSALRDKDFRLPWFVNLLLRIPILRDIPPTIAALGVTRVRLENP